MWKCKSVQVCNERGTVGTASGVISRLSADDGWEFEVGDLFVLATRADVRLRLPSSLVVVEEQRIPDEKPAKRAREVA